MTPMLRRSAVLAPCDECGRAFDPVQGGVCPRCGRLLCGMHLYRSLLRKMLGYLGVPTDCAQCRRK